MSLDDGPSSVKRPRLPGLKHTVQTEMVKEEEESKPLLDDVIVESGPIEYVQGMCSCSLPFSS